MAEKQASSVTVCAFAMKTLILIIMALQNLISVTFWVKNEVFFLGFPKLSKITKGASPIFQL